MLTKLKVAIGTIVLYRTHNWCYNFGYDLNDFMRTHPGIPSSEAAYRLAVDRGEKFMQRFEVWA